MCLAQGTQRSDAGEAQPAALQSRVKYSTNEPLRSLINKRESILGWPPLISPTSPLPIKYLGKYNTIQYITIQYIYSALNI